MNRYLYALVRCVPNPRTGEFINIAAIAGRPETGDWSIRQVGNESRVRKLAGAVELEAVHGFLARVGLEIDKQQVLLDEEAGEPLGEDWLRQLYHDHRNVVQLSTPAPIVADNAEHALDILFASQIVDPVSQQRGFITKHRVITAVREAYSLAGIRDALIRPRVEVLCRGVCPHSRRFRDRERRGRSIDPRMVVSKGRRGRGLEASKGLGLYASSYP